MGTYSYEYSFDDVFWLEKRKSFSRERTKGNLNFIPSERLIGDLTTQGLFRGRNAVPLKNTRTTGLVVLVLTVQPGLLGFTGLLQSGFLHTPGSLKSLTLQSDKETSLHLDNYKLRRIKTRHLKKDSQKALVSS